jgi:hypothetical protein
MRISEINATNFLNHRALAISIPADVRVLLVAGPNGAGKSAIAQAVRLALTGDPVRGLDAKNQLVQLIRQGETAGNVSVVVIDPAAGVDQGGEYVYTVNLKSGTRTAKAIGEDAAPGISPLAIDPAEFLRLDVKARQKEMFRLAGVKMSADTITKALTERGHAPERIARAGKYLRLGFEAAATEARTAATEARGAWKSVTGETYGDVKAESWRAPVPEKLVEGSLDDVRASFEAAKAAAAVTREKLQKLQAQEEATRGVEKLTAAAEALQANQARVTVAEKEATALAEEVERLSKKSAHGSCVIEPCPACGVALSRDGSGRLIEAKDKARSAEEMKAEAAEIDAARAKMREANNRLAAARQAVADGQAAKTALASIPKRPATEELEAATRANSVACATLAEAESDLNLAERGAKAAAEAAARTDLAKSHHQDVVGYVALAEGIEALPGEFLTSVIGKVNGLLAEAAAAFDQPIVVGSDMAPLYGTIPYALCSESQQWRIRMALGYAIAILSGVGILILDGFDVLEPRARGPLLKFLASQERVQVLLLGTLKERPNLPATFAVEWLG